MKGDFKALKIIHMAMSVGMILIYLILGSTSTKPIKVTEFNSGDLIYLALPVLAFLVSNIAFKFNLKKVNPQASLEEKFPTYRLASLSRWGILESVVIIIIILKTDLLLFGILIIIYFLFLSPSEEGMRNDFRSLNS